MKRYEKESLAKNFIIFFALEMILLVALFIQDYNNQLHNKLDSLESDMKLCSFNLECPQFQLDFIPNDKSKKLDSLYINERPTIYFKVPTVKNYLLQISMPKGDFQKLKRDLKLNLLKKFLIYAAIIALLSFLLSLYTLWPLKKALKLNDEFIKDILHDINTPLSSMVINFKLLKREYGNNRKIDRIESNINTILSMQNNLKAFLNSSKLQKEMVDIKDILEDRVDYFKKQNPNIEFISDLESLKLYTNKDAFIRILDNILSNSVKYSKDNGTIRLKLKNSVILIEDNGIGIKNVKRVFERFYTENERGIGIGLHIVKKLCDALGIKIKIKSRVDVGTKVYLKLR